MATLTVKSGMDAQNTLPHCQILFIGKQKMFKELKYEGILAKKLEPLVTEQVFQAAFEQLGEKARAVPIYLNLAKGVSVGDEVSRHNAPSNSVAIFKAVNGLSTSPKVERLSVVLFVDYADVMASVAAVARSFPLFSMKSGAQRKETGKDNNKDESSKELRAIDLEVVVSGGEKSLTEEDIKFLQRMAENIRQCARLGDTPGNILHPEAFADEAIAMVEKMGVKVQSTIIKGEELREKGFGGIYSVGKAALRAPVFACFSHTPANATESIAFVGKGITFDTGGYSLKPGSAMLTMKFDMLGAAAVLGAFCTLVQSGFKQNLHCLLCIAENAVSPMASKPDDIITMLSGKTVEITNTDAEGRLVLADGVFYAKTELKANMIIDLATLTGAQRFATGIHHAAILCNSEQLEAETIKWGKTSGDLVHPLPYCPDLHFDCMKSKVADMINANMSGKTAGPPSALAGLFVGTHIDYGKAKEASGGGEGALPIDWLHVDLAFPSMSGDRGTGFGVALLAGLLSRYGLADGLELLK